MFWNILRWVATVFVVATVVVIYVAAPADEEDGQQGSDKGQAEESAPVQSGKKFNF